MKLNDVFSTEFLNKLNALNPQADLNFNEEINGFIDVKKILEELNFDIIFDNQMIGSGRIDQNRIYIDSSEGEPRRRFSMAHELGHAVQNNRHANRNDDSSDYSAEDKKDEVFANTFAAQFLMPKKLVVEGVQTVIADKGFNAKCLQDGDVSTIIEEVAKKLKVSKIAMKYRIDNLGIFIPTSGE
ncbi:ImmA/IrrE family metallo-endopeptidase [Levilactobacillus brevis]|uniref:ImmA/IrrE family metallo-endopeptidase n=1 Tax=Levilactobacillus brevis TaxID=1580 RepID=A0AAJ5FJ57_LEVBR|nr:ImmA/IrrE family metallo-endopeptidase [Levilactobacillus brevis]ARN89320.1 hypothetical protein AZI09_01480 [Levilactobacillus brevis]ARN96898.1 hypothetical protein AZI10_01465 [Levilactobacillus brevis]AWP47386.1 hypothetical protein CCS05_10880 [Levilactobacillus brevis]RAY08996.1 ImmA/IrrE family metallo-endopeptidase [Levilactobacillus brevis]TOY84916.1 ImmA/IrrE family metallo-endopeptidase [Levilactobacillus brevis]